MTALRIVCGFRRVHYTYAPGFTLSPSWTRPRTSPACRADAQAARRSGCSPRWLMVLFTESIVVFAKPMFCALSSPVELIPACSPSGPPELPRISNRGVRLDDVATRPRLVGAARSTRQLGLLRGLDLSSGSSVEVTVGPPSEGVAQRHDQREVGRVPSVTVGTSFASIFRRFVAGEIGGHVHLLADASHDRLDRFVGGNWRRVQRRGGRSCPTGSWNRRVNEHARSPLRRGIREFGLRDHVWLTSDSGDLVVPRFADGRLEDHPEGLRRLRSGILLRIQPNWNRRGRAG